MVELGCDWLGLRLANPFVVGASPLCDSADDAVALVDVGASAVVVHSLFEEQLIADQVSANRYLDSMIDTNAEAPSFLPETDVFSGSANPMLRHVRRLTEVLDVPVVASLNGVTPGGWTGYARELAGAGAAAIELNLYDVATDLDETGEDIEERQLSVVADVVGVVDVPVSVKLSPFYASVPNFVTRLEAVGAAGVVLFNRFYQPDLDLEKLEVVPHLALSQSHEMRLPLRWIAILHGRVNVDLALSTGVHRPEDALKALMAGAKVAMTTSALLQKGPERIAGILKGMVTWLEDHEYESVRQMQGSMSQKNVAEPAAFERANYMKVLQSWSDDPAGQLPV